MPCTQQTPPLTGLAYINCPWSSTSQAEAHGVTQHTDRSLRIHSHTHIYRGRYRTALKTSPPFWIYRINSPGWIINRCSMMLHSTQDNFSVGEWEEDFISVRDIEDIPENRWYWETKVKVCVSACVSVRVIPLSAADEHSVCTTWFVTQLCAQQTWHRDWHSAVFILECRSLQ